MTILQFLQDKTPPGTKIPMANIGKMMNNVGYPFDWRTLKNLKEKNKALAELIGNFDEENGKWLTIGNSEDEENDDEKSDIDVTPPEPDLGMEQPDMGMGSEPPTEPEVDIADGRNPERSTVDKMAARAARF